MLAVFEIQVFEKYFFQTFGKSEFKFLNSGQALKAVVFSPTYFPFSVHKLYTLWMIYVMRHFPLSNSSIFCLCSISLAVIAVSTRTLLKPCGSHHRCYGILWRCSYQDISFLCIVSRMFPCTPTDSLLNIISNMAMLETRLLILSTIASYIAVSFLFVACFYRPKNFAVELLAFLVQSSW